MINTLKQSIKHCSIAGAYLSLLFVSWSPLYGGQLPIFSQVVESFLKDHVEMLQHYAEGEAEILNGLLQANTKNQALTSAEILQLDQRWRQAEKQDEFILSHLTNPAANALIRFKREHPEYTEIFITDRHGLNVGQTNRTSDYYQADEDWWKVTFNQGQGLIHHSDVEYDISSKSESIAIYLPIKDRDSKQVIGVMKAVLDINAF